MAGPDGVSRWPSALAAASKVAKSSKARVSRGASRTTVLAWVGLDSVGTQTPFIWLVWVRRVPCLFLFVVVSACLIFFVYLGVLVYVHLCLVYIFICICCVSVFGVCVSVFVGKLGSMRG